jgi:hypothetical protein
VPIELSVFPEPPVPNCPPVRGRPRPTLTMRIGAVLALRPVVARTAAVLTPGPLRGFIDHIEAARLVAGWAQDMDHPELPVLLEALLDGRVIGTALACHHRPDFASAGLGHGRCGFRMTTTEDLRPASLARLHVRRAADQSDLPITPECREQVDADRLEALLADARKAT